MRGALFFTRLDYTKSWHFPLVFTGNSNGIVRTSVIDNDDFPLAAPGLRSYRLYLHPKCAGCIITGNYCAEFQGFAPFPGVPPIIPDSASRFVHGFPATYSRIR
jgi:hypothetical protein